MRSQETRAWILLILGIWLLASGCGKEASPSPLPVSTAEEPTSTETVSVTISPEPTASPPPSKTAFPSATWETSSTSSPTIPLPPLAFPTQTATMFPQPASPIGAIQFYKPGPMSQVTSSVSFYGYAIPGYDDKGLVELYGEDGALLNQEILQLKTAYKWAFFSWRLNFNVRGAGELGRLSLSTRDEYGRIKALRAVHLLLQSTGPDIINPPEALVERCILEYPTEGNRVKGGKVKVSGEMQSYNDLPLSLDLVGIDGAILGSQLVPIPPGQAGKYFIFQVEIPYKVPSSTAVLLSISQPDNSIPGLMYLYSTEIILNP